MNLVLFSPEQEITEGVYLTNTRQSEHLKRVLRVRVGDMLRVGVMGGALKHGYVVDGSALELAGFDASGYYIKMDAQEETPPPRLPVDIVLALPRPQMIKRILQTVSCMGIRSIHFFQSEKVEKSYWQSPVLEDDALHTQLLLGLEQGMDTQLPQVQKHTQFWPFVENTLGDMAVVNDRCVIAHPGDFPSCPRVETTESVCLAIGPEGGFTEREVAAFVRRGFSPVQLGQRILKVETAIPVLLASLFSL